MSRVELMDSHTAPLLARPFYENGDDPGPIVGALAQVPELLDVAMPFLSATLGPSFISLRAKEIVILRTSAVLRCSYCVASHTVVASDAGLTGDELIALREERPVAEVFTEPAELALIQWVDALALGRGGVDDAIATDVLAHWGQAAVVELTVLVGTTMMLNRLCMGLQLPSSDETIQRLGELGFSR